ncbi:M28 family peptidase [Micrococcus flavus]|uniref:Acetylornithine deacetylase/succinyl-diaminopimelate desuccinylase-like protein n=1 Tax=Micrococcus flavus TaxID=384602 RepID=A0A4Y8WZK6_9MICC|nr:M28 family peptidase [Micrococcus flavus]MBB4882452.1 acetylornithine deacetylase/succinyl-diaminopimelate desuccinylase-like protein [Micrococcus flavus]TFI01430.1 M28 family peptidase [Micrococcus flavus]GGK37549.1 aminopeptidase YwaD [Micrococcus flavus]
MQATTPTSRRSALALGGLIALTGGAGLVALRAATSAGDAGAEDPRSADAAPTPSTPLQTDPLAGLDVDRALDVVRRLTREVGQRAAGTPGEAAAADLIARLLRDLGYEVEESPFTVGHRSHALLSGPSLTRDGFCWGAETAPRGRHDVTVTGRLVAVAGGSAADLPADLAGAVLLAEVEGVDVTALATAAVERGAAALLCASAEHDRARNQAFPPELDDWTPLPVVGVGRTQLTRLRADALDTEVTVQTWAIPEAVSRNVLATRRGTGGDDRGCVIVGAHYDTVIGTVGANDNAAGVALVLELAAALRDVPTEADLLFVLWGAEEIGLKGSDAHRRALTPDQRQRIRGVLNNDMVATTMASADRYWMLAADGEENAVHRAVRAAAAELGRESAVSEVETYAQSDHHQYDAMGVPAGNFGWRATGGPMQSEPQFHAADDLPEQNVDRDRLRSAMEIQALAAVALARS